jgi:DNA-binding MarR family transcriptional regulator
VAKKNLFAPFRSYFSPTNRTVGLFSVPVGQEANLLTKVQHAAELAKSLRMPPLDKGELYVYTCFMSDFSPEAKLAIANQIPATCMGLHIRRASRILTQMYDVALRPMGLEANQFTLLVAIHLFQSVPITRLAQELFTDQTTMTRNVKLLAKQGLVVITPGKDRRIKLISLTTEGQTALEQALPVWEQVQTELMQQFGKQNWQTLLSLLSELKKLS